MTKKRERLLRRGDYIWGSFVKPEKVTGYIVGMNPGDRSDVLGRFPFSEGSVDDAVASATRGGVLWRPRRYGEKAASIRRYRDVLSEHQDAYSRLITRETGKPMWESRQEVIASIRAVDLLLEEAPILLQPRILDEREARSDNLPRGVIGMITPFNFPLLIPTIQVTAALISGNTVVMKPSKFTPGVGQAVAELFDQCRLSRGAFNLIQGSGTSIGARLSTHPGLDALLFSGSFQTAMTIRRATFDRPELPSHYQCGGKGAAIVVDTSDLDRAVYEVMVGAFLTAGQRHNSTARVIVTKEAFEPFVDALVRRTQRLKVGYGFDDDVLLGPVISGNHRNRYRRYGDALVGRGHTPLLPAKARAGTKRKGFYCDPAVYWVNWENGHGFLNEEPPGPMLLVYRVNSWEEGVSLHNQLIYRSSTSLFIDPAHSQLKEILSRLKTGAINLNRGTPGGSLRLPSVGLGRSSNGLPAQLSLVRFLTAPRSTLVEARPFDSERAIPGVNW